MTKILIGALACHAYPERRRRCLEAWGADALKANMDVVFLLGGADDGPRREGLNLLLPCPDDYESLTQKSRGLFEWALAETDCDFVFKCDDDTYLRPDRLLRLAQLNADYVGAEWTEGAGYGSGGAGYLLSRKAARVAALGLAGHPQGVEDLLVGEILKSAGIEMTRTDNLIAYANDSARPKPTNSIISAHAADDPWKSHAVEFAGKLPFVTCEPMGRLGNLLFQVAAVLGYASDHESHQPLFALEHVAQYSSPFFEQLRFARLSTEAMAIGDAADFTYTQPPCWPSRSVRFTGYMQSEKYFSHCRDFVFRSLAPSDTFQAKLLSRYRHLLGPHTVSLHVRRGDYLTKPEHHPVQSLAYYRRAIAYCDSRVDIQRIVCCSDDPQWCREHLSPLDERIVVIEGNDESEDLWLMSLCRHHIMANSAFSWWAAWFGAQAESGPRIVIAPTGWFGPAFVGYSDRDIVPADWTRLGSA